MKKIVKFLCEEGFFLTQAEARRRMQEKIVYINNELKDDINEEIEENFQVNKIQIKINNKIIKEKCYD